MFYQDALSYSSAFDLCTHSHPIFSYNLSLFRKGVSCSTSFSCWVNAIVLYDSSNSYLYTPTAVMELSYSLHLSKRRENCIYILPWSIRSSRCFCCFHSCSDLQTKLSDAVMNMHHRLCINYWPYPWGYCTEHTQAFVICYRGIVGEWSLLTVKSSPYIEYAFHNSSQYKSKGFHLISPFLTNLS